MGRAAPELPQPVTTQVPEAAEPAGGETRVEMVNVIIHLDAAMTLQIRRLSGKLLRANKSQTPSFDDNRSYIIDVDSAEIAVGMPSMTHMMNTYVFGDPDAPLKDLRLSIEGGQVKQEGTIRKGPGIPFEMIGEMSPTPDGKIRIHPKHMRAGKLPVKGLMKLFGVDMAKLINTRNTRGSRWTITISFWTLPRRCRLSQDAWPYHGGTHRGGSR